jgi:hypothetical protein
MQKRRRVQLLAWGLTVGLVTTALAQARLSLIVNGSVASHDIRMIGGRPYAPLADIARAYDQTLVKKPGGYELTPAGGAGQIGDQHSGKIGDELFTGEFRFKVLQVREVSQYTTHYSQDQQTVTPAGANDTLFVVDCRIKNGTKQRQELVSSTNDLFGNPNTALADDQEHSYRPLSLSSGAFNGYDVHADETAPTGTYLLPGAAIDFALVFSVPKGTHPKDLVYSILKYGDRSEAKQKAVDVRVSLAP